MATYIIYQDNEVRNQNYKAIPYHLQKANDHWLKHYANSKYLTFFAKNEPLIFDRLRAQHELTICARKMAYWQRHPNWDIKSVNQQIEQIDKMWASKATR
jgi:hypothetical protein